MDDIKVFEPSEEGDSTVQVTVRCYRSTGKNEAPHRLSFDLDTTRQKIPKITTPRAAKAYSHHSHIEKNKQTKNDITRETKGKAEREEKQTESE